VRFWGRGWGHGAGMCQWCAKAMAERGYTAAEIVTYFYSGARLAPLPP
jgi:stage II sporulation protein D